MYNEFKKYILNSYNDFVRKGETKEDSLALVVYIIKSTLMMKHLQPITYGLTKDFSFLEKGNVFYYSNLEEIQKYKSLKPEQIKTAIKELVDSLDDIYAPDKKRTNNFTAKLIQNIISYIDTNKTVIDLSVGKGTLLKNMVNPIVGQDIDLRQVIISELLLSKYNEIGNFFQGDSIETTKIFNKDNSIFVFDPPMGDLRPYPKGVEWAETNILSTKPARLQSEILFLINFLLHAKDNDYFIGLFPENILNKNNKEYNSIRKYLISHSLISVIKVPSGHVILVGQKELKEKNDLIPVIRIQKKITGLQLSYIAENSASGKWISEKEFILKPLANNKNTDMDSFEDGLIQHDAIFYTMQDRKALIKNNNEISLPIVIKKEENIIRNPKELFNDIASKESKIRTTFENLKLLIDDLPEISTKKEAEKLWFEKIKQEDQTDEINALKYFYKMEYNLSNENIKKPQNFQIRERINKDSLKNISILYKFGRISFKNKNNLNIHFDENDNKRKDSQENFFEYFNPKVLDENIEKLLNMTDEIVKKVYENHCQYCINELEESATYIANKEYSSKDIVRALQVLEKLGLVIKVDLDEVEKKSTISLYDQYLTYFPDLSKRGINV